MPLRWPAARPDAPSTHPAWTRSVALAVVSLIGWFVVYRRLQPATFYDESSHLAALRAIASGDYRLHPELPMFPGYHWLVHSLSWWTGGSLTAARLTSLGFALAGVFIYTGIRNRVCGPDPYAPLRFAWLPLLFPFTAMAYTDVPSVVLLLGALWAATRGRFVESALWFAAACAVRQTNVVLALILIGWVTLDAWPAVGVIARRVVGYAVVAIGCVVVFVTLGRVQAYPVEGQEVTLNGNHLFMVAALALILWLPVWLWRAPSELRWLRAFAERRPARTSIAIAAGVGAGVWLYLDYSIRHAGNAFTGYFIRNEPLLWMRDSATLRAIAVALSILAVYLLTRLIWTQPARRTLTLVCVVGVLHVAPHGLIEPRYYLVPCVLFGLFIQLPGAVERRLVAWQAMLCAGLAALVWQDWLW